MTRPLRQTTKPLDERSETQALTRYLSFLGCPEDLIEDLIQDARLALLERERNQAEVSDRLSFLRVCARNQLIDRARTRRAVPLPDPGQIAVRGSDFDELGGPDMAAHFIIAVRECIDRLSRDDRLLLQARYWNESLETEIAVQRSISISAVRKQFARARARVKSCIERRL